MASGFCRAATLTKCGVQARLVQCGRCEGSSGENSLVFKILEAGPARFGLGTKGRVFIFDKL
jgi:hypothetical protein